MIDAGPMPEFLIRKGKTSMPKSAKLADNASVKEYLQDQTAPKPEAVAAGEAAARPGNNGFDGNKLMSFVRRVESVQAEIDEIMSAAKDSCEPHRQDRAAIVKEASEAGFSKKEFLTILRKRRLEQKVEHVADSLDEDQRDAYELMMAALGQLATTPLGQAAVNQQPF